MFAKIFHLLLASALLFVAISGASQADENKILLTDELSLSAVCWENADLENWLDMSHHSHEIASSRYGLFSNLMEKPNGPLPFSETPYLFRLTVKDFPCFYEYSSHRYGGYGTFLHWSVPFGSIEIDGMSFPRVENDGLMLPIIKTMIDVCEKDMLARPLMLLVESCERQISDVLVSETTSVRIYNDFSSPDNFSKIIFIRGFPYLDGQPLYRF